LVEAVVVVVEVVGFVVVVVVEVVTVVAVVPVVSPAVVDPRLELVLVSELFDSRGGRQAVQSNTSPSKQRRMGDSCGSGPVRRRAVPFATCQAPTSLQFSLRLRGRPNICRSMIALGPEQTFNDFC
jgi:hypothetical protein